MSANWSNRQEDEAHELMPLLLDAINFAHETAPRPLSPEMERLGDLYDRMGNWCWCAEDHESRECPPHVDLSRAHLADRGTDEDRELVRIDEQAERDAAAKDRAEERKTDEALDRARGIE